MKKQDCIDYIDHLKKQIKKIRSGEISGDIHAIKKMINKSYRILEEIERNENKW